MSSRYLIVRGVVRAVVRALVGLLVVAAFLFLTGAPVLMGAPRF